MELIDWYHVVWDEHSVKIQADPPKHSSWEQEISWNSILKISFKVDTLGLSDDVYVFTS